MEEKRLNERESLELITRMIQETKNKLEVGDGNVLLIWGYVSVLTAILVYVMAIILDGNPWINWLWFLWLWFLIPLIGYPVMKREERKEANVKPHSSSYIDKISSGIWKSVGIIACVFVAICIAFMFCGYNCWVLMFAYAFIIVGFGSVAQGIIIRERSLTFGGLFSIAAGGVVTSCAICNIPLYMAWAIPLYILCFTLMTIIPGHIINRKAKKLCRKN